MRTRLKQIRLGVLLISSGFLHGCGGPGPLVEDSAADAAQEAAEAADPEASELEDPAVEHASEGDG